MIYSYEEEWQFDDHEETTMREWVSFDGETLDECEVEIVTYACGHTRRFETPVGLLTVPEDPNQFCFHCERAWEEMGDPFEGQE